MVFRRRLQILPDGQEIDIRRAQVIHHLQHRLPILAQTLLGRPRVVLGRIQGVVGLPQATGNPFFVNALGAVKALSRDLNEVRGKQVRNDGFLGRIKNLF